MVSRTIKNLTESGVSIWLDDLTRGMIESGRLSELISDYAVTGVTTNPAIFASAIASDPLYQTELESMRGSEISALDATTELVIADVQKTADVLLSIYENTLGQDGRVSVEVEPDLANDAPGTTARAKELYEKINRKNVMIKIPATKAGLEAITAVTALGISVNVTLIFGIARYREVVSAYMYGLELAKARGLNLAEIFSVASVFISRFDTKVAELLNYSAEEKDFISNIGIANADLVLDASEGVWSTERALYLLQEGANMQRLLWASTGVKDPLLPADYYVKALIAQNTINTIPEKTLIAVSDSTSSYTPTLGAQRSESTETLHRLNAKGIDYHELVQSLETEGLEKFSDAYSELLKRVEEKISA